MQQYSPILTRRQLFLMAGATSGLLAADEDFWNTKPVAEWSAGEIYRLMNRSPWANPVQWWRPSPQVPSSDQRPRSQLGAKGVVTWESAQPIRDAMKISLPPVFANLYVIGVRWHSNRRPLRRLSETLQRVTLQRQASLDLGGLRSARTDPK